uniref:Ig-like domain-containing protein n=1 Tax=Cyprinus carpio carpio TaxID=630221 RepID=A0A8C1C7U2_CYPCA
VAVKGYLCKGILNYLNIITLKFVINNNNNNNLTCENIDYHEFWLIEAYGDSDQEDDEHVAHVDFKEQKEIITLPDFAGQIELPSLYEDAKKGVSIYPPWSSIYPKSDPQLNVKNTLICHVTRFFPPPVRVLWTKNNVNGTLNLFSQLSFIPEEGDIYSCSVEHKALQQPQTRITEPSTGPSVFCGVALALGLLGLATGAVFIAKRN